MTTWVLVQTEVGAAARVAAAAAGVAGVGLVDDVTGPYDVIVRLDGADDDALAGLHAVQRLPGVTRTLTCHPDGRRPARGPRPAVAAAAASPERRLTAAASGA